MFRGSTKIFLKQRPRVLQCATAGVPATVDIFAPGHIGELTQVVPVELVDAVLEETRTRERRLRNLPSRVGVYLVLALGLFEHLGARLVWEKLVGGLECVVPSPSEKSLRDLRRRLGSAPMERLFEVLACPLAQPSTAGVRYRLWRTVAFDGCSSIPVPDHERNRSWLGRTTYRLGLAGYPRLMLMTLCETGTRGLLAACFGPTCEGERSYARRLANRLTGDMLVLADRGFDSNDLLTEIVARGAQFLVRCKSTRSMPVLTLLPDGSYLTRIGQLRLRVVEGEIHAHTDNAGTTTGTYRLVTTLTDHRTDPADQLLRLYHERWEVESAYLALGHTLLKGRVLRSKNPEGITQEMWGLLALYQALRSVIVTAVETLPGCDPDRAGFTVALEAARDSVVQARALPPSVAADGHLDLAGHIGSRVLQHLLPPRRSRISARIVKRGISRYHTWNRDNRPRGSTPVIAVTFLIQPPPPPTVSSPGLLGRWPQVSQLMATDPGRAWTAQEIAHRLALTAAKPFRSLAAQLGTWTRRGLLMRTGPSTYRLTQPEILTSGVTP